MSFGTGSWEEAIHTPNAQTAYFTMGGPTGHEIEDRLTVLLTRTGLTACIADGHWGAGAAEQITDFWSEEAIPHTRDEALEKVKQLEAGLFATYRRDGIDPEADFTPEAAFIAIDIGDRLLRIAGYGDCRLHVVNDGQARFELSKEATWLGVFSHMGLRQRKSVDQALSFEQIGLVAGDYVMLFTDGLDEWGHDGVSSISTQELASTTRNVPAREAVRSLGNLAFSHGAQDDVSLFIHRIE
jgi:hypothetical protein